MAVKEMTHQEVKKIIKDILKKYNIEPKTIKIGESEYPDEKGEYYIFVRAKNKMSFEKGSKLEKLIEKDIRKKLGKNFLLSLVPELTDWFLHKIIGSAAAKCITLCQLFFQAF